jgi:SAM-dependent methyltransferase
MRASDHHGAQVTETLTRCPLCDSTALRYVDDVALLQACAHCGYVFNNPRPSPEEIADYYSRPAKYDSWIAHEGERDALWRRRLDKMSVHAVPGSLLDVGAGTGQFLAHARHRFGPVLGTEVSTEAQQIAAERYGVAVVHGEIQDIDLPAGAFDNVTMFHVLEHVHDPRRAVRACRRVLADDGRLFVAVPNDRRALTRLIGAALRTRSVVARALGRQVPSPKLGSSGLPRLTLDGEVLEIHLSHFTAAVLIDLLEREGFEALEVSADPFFVAGGLSSAVHRLAYTAGQTLARRRVHLYPTLWVAARPGSPGQRRHR